WHEAPRLAHGACELGKSQLAAGEIGTNAALAFRAMAIPAAGVGTFPKRFAGLRITGLCGNASVSEQEHDRRRHKCLHNYPPPLKKSRAVHQDPRRKRSTSSARPASWSQQ